ncbi:MAG: hypothetical protein IT287_04275, partial [Bdellovibrionaceae bacterium]|nr:hypothetical protein [Pseudobdellovibrionaceae bacterium]
MRRLFLSKNWKSYLACLPILLIVLDALLIFNVFFPKVFIGFDLQRDIQRTQALLGGTLLLSGPDFSLADYAYGPFYYLLMSPLVWLTGNIFFVAIVHCLSRCIGTAIIAKIMENELKVPFFYGYCFVAASSYFMTVMLVANNASLLLTIGAVLFYVALYPFKNQIFKICLLSLLAGLFLQIHTSVILIVPLLIAVYSQKGTSGMLFKKASYAGVCFVLTFIPYAIARINSVYGYPMAGPIFFSPESFMAKPSMTAYIFERVYNWAFDGNIVHYPVLGLQIIILFFYLFIRVMINYKSRDNLGSFHFKVLMVNCMLLLIMAPWVFFNHWYRYYLLLFILPVMILLTDLYRIIFLKINNIFLRLFLFLMICVCMASNPLIERDVTRYSSTSVQSLKQYCEYFNNEQVSFKDMRSNTFEILEVESVGSVFLAEQCFKYKDSSQKIKFKYLFVSKKRLEGLPIDELVAGFPQHIQKLYPSGKSSVAFENAYAILYKWPRVSQENAL